MKHNIITVEMLDGTTLPEVRVLFADKIRLEKSARANGWDIARDEIRVQSFLAWAAAQRTGQTEASYEDFLDQIADVAFEQREPEDPTRADTSA